MEAPSPAGEVAAENVRKRIAREIHDDFGQRAAALAMMAGAFSGKLDAADPLAADLRWLGEQATALGEDLRRFSHDLHPSQLERLGLAESLRTHASFVAGRHSLELELALPASLDGVPFEVALALFRVAQQSLDNVVRHAGATRVRLELRRERSALRLLVADDGRGFDGAAAQRAGLGLTAIAERAELFGGSASFERGQLGGAQVAVWIPLPEARGPLGRLELLLRRHRGAVIATLLIIVALASGLVTAGIQARRAREEARRADATVRFLESLFEAGNPRRTRGQIPDARVLLERGSRLLEGELADQPLQRGKLLDTLGNIETELGLFERAADHLAEALSLQRAAGADQLELASTLSHAGRAARLSGQKNSAGFYREALELREERLGAGHPETIRTRSDLGAALAAGGAAEEAEILLREALRQSEQMAAPDERQLARILHNLAGLAHQREDFGECERLLQRTLAIRERILEPDDLDLIETREALAVLLLALERPAEATALLEQLRPQVEKIYGESHPTLARVLFNLALAWEETGHRAEAEALLEKAAAIAETHLAAGHPVRLKIEALQEQIRREKGATR